MANFLQLTPENIAQARNLSWKDAWNLEKDYKYNPTYTGKDKTSWLGHKKQGLKSLVGMFEPGSNVGGATPLTRKLALGAIDYAPKAMGIASKALGPLSFLFNATPANADEVEWEKQLMKNQQFKQQQLMNRRKQDMQQRIRQAEAADAKAKADAVAHKEAQATGGDYHSGHESTVDGQTTDWGDMSHMIARGGLAQHAPRYANGGLIDFFRYGGFSG